MDFERPVEIDIPTTAPQFANEARKIRGILASMSSKNIERLQHVSPALALRGAKMNHDATPPTKQALWAYKGDVYKGFKADSIKYEAAHWAQSHIRIPSGMYGILRPFDAIIPYRLEMKTKLSVDGNRDLYDFWGNRLARTVEDESVVVLASDEYARAVVRHLTDKANVYDVSFVDQKADGREVKVPIYNKQMRGVAARWLADVQAENPTELRKFCAHGYHFSAARSTDRHYVFYRDAAAPIRL